MDDYKPSEKELLVLKYLIDNESRIISDEGLKGTHFYAYPGKIETELKPNISRVYAKEICNKYKEMGILSERVTGSSKSQSGKIEYFINSDLNVFKDIVRLIVENTDKKSAVKIFGCAYFQYKINAKLVKTVLCEKGAVLRKNLDIFRWDGLEARALFKEYRCTKKVQIDFSSDKTAEDQINEMPDSDIKSFDIYMQRKLDRLGTKEDVKSDFYPVELCINLPILDMHDGRGVEGHIEEIKALNKQLFEQYPSLINCFSAIEDHYYNWQESNLIEYFLVLIKTSTSALGEFLCGDWVLDKHEFCQDILIGHLERIMHKLLFLTVGDLTLTGSYPKNDLINCVGIRPEIIHNGGKTNALVSFTYDGRTKERYFDSRFTIDSSINDEENVRDPWKVVDRGCIYCDDIRRLCDDFIDCIKDYSEIVNYLRDGEKPVSKIISSHFSPVTRNLLEYCNPAEEIPQSLKEELNKVLIDALTNENWNKLLDGGCGELSIESEKWLQNHLRMIEEEGKVPIIYRIGLGSTILSDVFAKAIEVSNNEP